VVSRAGILSSVTRLEVARVSIQLPTIDLAGAGVGFKGTIDLKPVGLTADPSNYKHPPTLQMFNDSGVGLKCTTRIESHSFSMPAGAWRNVTLTPGESNIDFVAEYVLPNPPVSKLMSTYYLPNEPLDPIGTLGNSPIGGGVQTSSIQTLSNEGASAGTLVIDMGPAPPGQVVSIFNDHFLWKVVTSLGVAHQVLAGNIASPFLQLGAAADLVEALGNLLVDGTFQSNGQTTINNSGGQTNIIGGALQVNGISTFLEALFPNLSGTTVNGSVSGSTTLYEVFQGNVKLIIMSQTGYRSTAQSIALPTAFTRGGFILAGGIGASGVGGVQFLKASVAQNIAVITTLATGGGSPTTVTTINAYSIGETGSSGFDTVNLLTTGANTNSGNLIVIGV